ncbi:ParB N-terminal domain-containing protein [Candidatus Merdisoma sp. JLR.KK006]|uniref:ParB N-terminal domain-containing protein n=1 Tax=Candidatus Merdisoma sp. JLR.KK006 TaxID=3112626 RepID=UPI002FF003DF
MKANGTKRKIFNDAVDLLSGAEEVSAPENGIRMLPIDSIRLFRKHPFRLYEGERLDDMVESIREHGILNPVIVWKVGDNYEMLAGHNRQMAGKLAGLTEIPAIVKTDLTEEEAYVYVIETNVIQRGFAELLPSEKAAVLAERYEKVSNQGKRNDILEEIARLNGSDMPETCGHDVHKLKSRDAIGEEYGMTGRNIARYMRVQQLEEPLRERLDDGTLPLVAAVDLSYLSDKEQKTVSGLAEQGKIKLDVKTAKCIRDMAGNVTEKKVLETLNSGKGKKSVAGKSIRLSVDVYEKYFSGVKSAEVAGIVEEALAAWFEKGGEADVPDGRDREAG